VALTFTDPQIQETTGQMVATASNVAGANANIAKAQKVQQDYLDLDDANRVYTDNYQNIITQYHTELQYLDGEQRTAPNDTDIENAGQLAPGNIYFPSGWGNIPPSVVPYTTGMPFTEDVIPFEERELPAITQLVTFVQSGLSGGGTSSATSVSLTSVGVNDTTVFSNGNTIIVLQGSNYLYGTITAGGTYPNTGPTAGTLTVNTLGSSNTLPGSGAIVAASAAPGSSTVTGALSAEVAVMQFVLEAEQTALNANDSIGTDGTAVQAALTNVASALTAITNWLASPSPFTTGLSILTAMVSTRTPQVTARVTAVTNSLGTVTQNSDGSYTGTGDYFEYFANVDQRVNKIGGTLRNYYQQDLVISVLGQQVVLANNQASRDSTTFTLKLFAVTANGTSTIKLKDATNLTVDQAVKICSDTQPVVDAIIEGIQNQTVQLNVSIPSTYQVNDNARLVFQNT
jgi:hypothetical protein